MSYGLRNDIDLAMLVMLKQQITAAQQGEPDALTTAQALVDSWIGEISPLLGGQRFDLGNPPYAALHAFAPEPFCLPAVEPTGEPNMPIYDDAYLNHYCDRYVWLALKRHGIRLVDYLAEPELYEERALGPLPPLPQQLQVQRQIDAETERQEACIEHLPRRGGVPTEPLRHKRHPKRSWLGFFTRKVKA